IGAATTQIPGNTGTVLDADTFTSVFNQLQLFADSTTTQFDTNLDGTPGLNFGDRFSDNGTAFITDFLPPLGDDEGISFLSEITVAWEGLKGITTSDLHPINAFGDVSQTISYDPNNTVLNFYFHGDASGPNANFGSSVGANDNTGFTDGQKILEIQVTGGDGTNTFDQNGNFLSGSSILMGEVVFALEDFWWFDDGDTIPGTGLENDFNTLIGLPVPILLTANIDQNTDEVITDFSRTGAPGPDGFGDILFDVHSTHDGSLDFAMAQVPTPQTFILLGLGLVLFPLFGRRILTTSLSKN
ncbi:MAG TPA: hypothetical protein VFP93_02715, partial [Gammaproteobacteria bacterium]|nr:hypothetical protein [Gammaproteobacteria bacterium]